MTSPAVQLNSHLMNTYPAQEVTFVSGKGTELSTSTAADTWTSSRASP